MNRANNKKISLYDSPPNLNKEGQETDSSLKNLKTKTQLKEGDPIQDGDGNHLD